MDEKIVKLYQNLKNEGVDDIRANDIIQKVKEYYEYLSNYNLEQLDYIGALKAIQYGRFLKSNNAGGDNAKVWNDTKVYSDNDVVIWKPRNYQESSIIGSPQWCISFRDYHWNDHVIHNGETIYMIYNGWANEDLQYTSACVERNGNIIIYDSNHNKLNDIDKESFLKSLGDGISVLKPQINVENKQYNTNRNMNKKVIRLTEQDLHKIVKESVGKIISEGGYYDYVFGDEEPKMKLDWHDKNSSVTEDKDNAALDSARYYIQKYHLEGKGLDSLLREVGLAAINTFLTDTESGKRIAQLSTQLGFENDIYS